eukprot:321326-Pelagomonas_calceolata.AAC.1
MKQWAEAYVLDPRIFGEPSIFSRHAAECFPCFRDSSALARFLVQVAKQSGVRKAQRAFPVPHPMLGLEWLARGLEWVGWQRCALRNSWHPAQQMVFDAPASPAVHHASIPTHIRELLEGDLGREDGEKEKQGRTGPPTSGPPAPAPAASAAAPSRAPAWS